MNDAVWDLVSGRLSPFTSFALENGLIDKSKIIISKDSDARPFIAKSPIEIHLLVGGENSSIKLLVTTLVGSQGAGIGPFISAAISKNEISQLDLDFVKTFIDFDTIKWLSTLGIVMSCSRRTGKSEVSNVEFMNSQESNEIVLLARDLNLYVEELSGYESKTSREYAKFLIDHCSEFMAPKSDGRLLIGYTPFYRIQEARLKAFDRLPTFTSFDLKDEHFNE